MNTVLRGDFDTKRTFPGVSARLCLMGLASHTTISAAKLLASMCHRTVYIFFAHWAVSWHELRLLGQRVTVLCSPDTFRQREGTRSIRDRLSTYRRRYSRRTGHLTRSVWFHVRAVARAVACAVSSDMHMVDSSSRSGLYSRTGLVHPIQSPAIPVVRHANPVELSS